MKAGDPIGQKYKLKQQIGTGAMGAVWEAVNTMTGRRVALKLILHSTPEHRRRLLREAQACGSLEHRNIVEIYDVGETDRGDPFLVMQLLSGETLGEMLKRKRRLEPALAARIGRDIASALVAAHEAKVIHRDLKPANIMLHRENGAGENEFIVKVLDFGVAKIQSAAGPGTQTGMMVGSPAYMSPEQVRVAKDLDHRSDLWSLGIMLFEMLAGVRPFNDTTKEMWLQILSAPIPSVASLVRHVPADLDVIVGRCLERERVSRYQSARELAYALNGIAEVSQASRVLVSIPPSPVSSPGRPAYESASDVRLAPAGRTPMGSGPEIMRSMAVEGSGRGSGVDLKRSEIDEATLFEGKTLTFVRGEPGGRRQMPSGVRIVADAQPIAEAATGTQVLSPEAPVASWRLEMQKALAAKRQPSLETMSVELIEEMQQGGTVDLPVAAARIEELMREEEREPSVTTTNAPSVQQGPEGAALSEAQVEAVSRRPKRDGKVWLYSTIGAGAAAIGALVLALGLQVSGSGGGKEAVSSAAPVGPTATPEAVVVEKVSTASVGPKPPPVATAAPRKEQEAAPTATVAALPPPKPELPGVATARVVTPPSPPPVVATVQKATPPPSPSVTVVGRALPKCSTFIKKNCVPSKAERKPVLFGL